MNLKPKNFLVVFVCLGSIALLAPQIVMYNFVYAADHPQCDAPVVLRFLGEGASIISNMSLLQADRYFHGGIGHIDDECRGIWAPVVPGAEEDGEHEHHMALLSEPGYFNILPRVSDALRVTEHIHLSGNDLKEIIPWLYYAVELDPHNVQAYLLIGYYVCDRLGKFDEGMACLRDGLKENPDSWEINAELGRLYYQHVKDYKAAVVFLSRADELLQKSQHDKFQERCVLTLLAYSYKALGQEDDARPLFQRIKELFPE